MADGDDPNNDEDRIASDEEMNNDDDEPEAAEDGDDDEPVEEEGSDEDNHVDDASRDEESSSEDEDGSSDDDDELQEYTDEHGVTQTLSTYEIQRLERIARNKAYLSSLGLDQEENKLKRVQQPKKEKRRDTLDPSELRSSSRRTAQVQVSYTESQPKWSEFGKGAEIRILAPKKERAKKIERKYERESRMDVVIYKEFKSVVSEKKQNLKQAEKNVRRAEVELKYFKKKVVILDRKHKRHQETAEFLNQLKEEKEHLGGLRDMLAEVDKRLPELIWAQKIFDENFFSQDELLKREEQKRENERKMEMIDAIDRFPRALKDAYYDLNALLLERAPKEKPPPRRGGRARKSEGPDEAVSSNADPDSTIDAGNGGPSHSDAPSTGGDWGNLATALAVEKSSSSAGLMTISETKDDTGASEQAGSKRRKKARNVGGWVSPLFSAEIDRAWIESDKFEPKADLSKYVPQIGDTVLYYPNGHRAFLAAHPDILGKAMRTKLRLPLWVRAEREKQKMVRNQLKKHGEELKADVEGKDFDDDGDDDDGTKSSPDWWNDEWLEGVEGKLGNYPLVCVVKDVHTEFPPDPNSESKVITDDGNGDVQIVWTVPTDVPGKKRTKSHPPVCLAVNLKALTPLLPPAKPKSIDADREELSPPPNFSVITFPSKDNAQPFLIPFAWGYKLTHSVKLEDKVRVLTRGDMKGSIKDFVTVHDFVGNCRFDDRLDEIAVYLSSLKSGAKGVTAALSSALSPRSRQKSNGPLSALPVTDAYVVIERFTSFLDSHAFGPESIKAPQNLSDHTLSDLIRSTLPIWNGVSILRHGMGKRVFVSPWELSLGKVAAKSQENESFQEATADLVAENGLTYNIDEPLRAKIECALEDFINSEEDSAIFYDHVTDEIAPSYSCAVPQGMCFAKVLQRLASHKAQWAAQPRCFYRTADSLLNDLTTILDNCLLYNSPDSDVVTKANEIVPSAKRIVSLIVAKHVREKESRSKADDDRRKAVLSLANSSAMMESTEGDAEKSKVAKKGNRAPKLCSFQGPYPEFLNRSWVEGVYPDNSLTFQKVSTSLEADDQSLRGRNWVPQSGDHVVYSRSMHSKFVKSHFDSLTTDQCALPQFAGLLNDEEDAASNDDFVDAESPKKSQGLDNEVLAHTVQTHWLVGKVVWVRAVFPRTPGKERNVASSFEEKLPLLALGINFDYEWAHAKQTHIIYWRPCKVSSVCGKPAPIGKLGSSCDICGCDDYFSFVYPAWYHCYEEASKEALFNKRPILLPTSTPTQKKSYFTPPIGLQKDEIASIDRCFNVLKRRCLGKIAPDYVDPKFCMANVKAGWCPTGKMGRALPTFESLLKIDGLDDSERAASQRTTVKNRKWINQEEESISVPVLAETHFLPPFSAAPPKQIIAKSNGNVENPTAKAVDLKYEEMMCPSPKLCLELVQHRLRSGYYRSRCGILDDLQEAYVNTSLLVLSKPAAKKFGPPFSVRRVAKALSASDGKPPSKRKNYKSVLKAKRKKEGKLEKKGTAIVSRPLKEETNGPTSPKKAGKVSRGEANGEPVDPKATILSDEETKCMEKIHTAKRLYATALVCVSETAHVEFVFGTAPKQAPAKAKIVPSKEFLDREQRFQTARSKLGMLLAAVLRDPCNNRAKGASLDLPFVNVRISGEDIVEKPQGDTPLVKHIVFSPLDYLSNKDLVKTFFGKPGKSDACARCQVYRRSMLTCRVQKAHSCPDFNWVEVFRDVGGIDGLLHMVRTGQPFISPQIALSTPVVDETYANKNESEAKDEDHEDGEADFSKDNDEGDPYDNLEKAQRAITLSNQVLDLAKKNASAPARLSQAFIKSYFPIDPSDGKYTTCVVCGLIGDVMCCEGHDCPVVSHPKCVGLEEAPEDDWFCVKCASIPKQEGSESASAPKLPMPSPFDPAVEEERKSKEFEELMEELQDILDELKCKRYKPKLKCTTEKYLETENADLADHKPASIPAEESDVKSVVDTEKKKGDENRESADKCVGTPGSENTQHEGSSGTGRSAHIDSHSEGNDIVVGAKIRKNFADQGDFTGVVKQLASSDNPYYRVRYDDGDEEDMSEAEVQDLLVLSSRRMSSKQSSRGRTVASQSRHENSDDSEEDDIHRRARSASAVISDARRRGRKRGKSIANNIISRITPAKKDKSSSNRTTVKDEGGTKYDSGPYRSPLGQRSDLDNSDKKDSLGQYRLPVTTTTTWTKIDAADTAMGKKEEQDFPNPSHSTTKRGRPKVEEVKEKDKTAPERSSSSRKRSRPRKELANEKGESIPQLPDASLRDESIRHYQSPTGKKRGRPRKNEASSPKLTPPRKRARPNKYQN